MKVRTRFAPSPTGFLHIGSLRTALYAFALAKHSNGDFILRIEDTDQKREVEGSTKAIQDTLKKFKLDWDEFYIQSQRNKEGIYQKAAEKLIKEGHAFYCQCKSKNAKEAGFSKELRDPCRDKKLTSGAIKLKVPENKTVSYYDFVHRKEISWNTNDVYDATLLKSDGFPTYHLAAMTDDLAMNITHILRGHDWLPSTPIHLLVFEYLGGKRPEIGHLTDILSNQTGKKLSKRRDSVFVEDYLKDGYLPEALLNFIMLLGWAPKNDEELFTLDEFIKKFDIDGFNEANPRFLQDKLDWFNGEYIRKMREDKLVETVFEYFQTKYNKKLLKEVIPLVQSRIKKLSEIESIAGFLLHPNHMSEPLVGLTRNYISHISNATISLEKIPSSDWNIHNVNNALGTVIENTGSKVGQFYMDVRGTIAGSAITPPINESMIILGKEKTIERLKEGQEKYNRNR